MSNRKALLIGINEYDFLGELKYAQQDAVAISKALQQYCGFDSDEITVVSCQSCKSRRGLSRYIEHAISSLRNYHDLEMLVFGFWGHGFSPSPGQRYLCGLDTDENDLQRTAVSFNAVRSQLAQVQAENTLLLLDCCQNAPAGRGTAETMTEGEETALASMARDIQAAQQKKQRHIIPTVAVLNACSDGQKAYEWPDREHGVFTAHLLDAFGQGFSSVAPMAAWTAKQVVKTSYEIHHKTQIPYVKIEGCGDIFLPKSNNNVPSKLRPKVDVAPDRHKKTSIGTINLLEDPRLNIETKPIGCLITIDGKSYGESPVLAELKAGQYSIKAECEGFKSWERRISFDGRGDTDLQIELSECPKPTMTLCEAAKAGDLEQVKRNLQNGTDINAEGNKGLTPLHYAARGNYTEVAKLLIDSGADVNKKCIDWTPLHTGALNGNAETVKMLLDNGADVNAKDKHGRTPLYLAIDRMFRKKLVHLLLENGANINTKNEDGHTPLYTTIFWDSIEGTRFLIDNGANINIKNNDGDTPLDYAILWEKLEIEHILRRNGAQCNRDW